MTDTDGKATAYAYDQLNQLVRVDDQKAGVSTTYRYDVGGNIAEKKTYDYTTGTLGAETGSVSYSYGDSGWKDLLTSYDGQAITSDEIGNPLSYRDGMEFTWEGRQLKTAAANGKSISYAYNSDGIRTGKTVDGTVTSYLLDGSTVIAQKTGDDVLWFLYDSDGTRVGFTYNGAAYYYMTNAQGDVTGIVDSSVNSVVEYSYDAWGKLLTMTGSMADTVGKINPFLYRGYYYDSETGFYYLNSRYYDPETGRFINADGAVSTGTGILGFNMFSYCNNDPTGMVDDGGSRPLAMSDTVESAEDQMIAAKFNSDAHRGYMPNGGSTKTEEIGYQTKIVTKNKYIPAKDIKDIMAKKYMDSVNTGDILKTTGEGLFSFSLDKMKVKYASEIGYVMTAYDIYRCIQEYGGNKQEKDALTEGLKNGTGVIYYDINCEAAGRTYHYSGVREWKEYPYID